MFVLVTAGTCLFVCLYCSSSSSTKKSIGNCQKKKNFKYFKFYTYLIAETKPYKPQRNQKLALGIQTYQILTNDDEVCIPSLSGILLAVAGRWNNTNKAHRVANCFCQDISIMYYLARHHSCVKSFTKVWIS